MLKRNRIFNIAISLITIGAIMAVAGFACGGYKSITGNFNELSVNNSKNIVDENKNLEKFNDIDMDLNFGDVQILRGDKYAIEAKYNKDIESLSYEVKDGKLTISGNTKKKVKVSFFNFGINIDSTRVKIYVPEDAALDKLNLEVRSGDLDLKNINSKDTNIICDFGDVNLEGLSADNLSITAKSGDLVLKDIETIHIYSDADFGDIKATNVKTDAFKGNLKSGDLKLNNSIVNKAVIKNDYGNITGSSLTTNGMDIDIKSGNVNIDGELKGGNVIKSSFGDINLKTSVDKNQYSYNIDVDFGDTVIDGNKEKSSSKADNNSAVNSINADCKSGDVKVDFKK